jgi:hypothetical protein
MEPQQKGESGLGQGTVREVLPRGWLSRIAGHSPLPEDSCRRDRRIRANAFALL